MPDLILPGAWQQCLADFLQKSYDRSGSAGSRATYLTMLRGFFIDPTRSPETYTQADVRAYLSKPSVSRRNPGAPISVSTRNSRLTALSLFYQFASAYEVNGKPLFTGKLPTAGFEHVKPDIRYRALSTSELERFFAAIPTNTVKGLRDHAIYLVYFYSARRRSEIARLTYGDIEPATFGDRAGHVYHYQGKGRARQTRTKELPAQAYAAIDTYLVASGRKETIQPGDGLFTKIFKGSKKPLRGDYLNEMFHAYALKAGLDVSRLSLHSLRHASSRERKQAGQDIIEIKDLLDHSSLQTTFLYLSLVAGTADSGAALLSAKFASLGALSG